jgi:hypothetical protein
MCLGILFRASHLISFWLDLFVRLTRYCAGANKLIHRGLNLVGLGGFEPPTSPLSGVRSNQLSYRPRYLSILRIK